MTVLSEDFLEESLYVYEYIAKKIHISKCNIYKQEYNVIYMYPKLSWES